MVIDRTARVDEVVGLLRTFRVVGVLGARQVGKTTLARLVASRLGGPTTVFDLERPEDVARLREPELALTPLRGLVVLDEIQRRPELFPVLRVLADRRPLPARFLVLGSASPELLRQTSETLAGRIGYAELLGFDCEEIPAKQWERLWLRGGFPLSFLARSDEASLLWRRAFVRDFLERDLPQLGFRVAAETMRRFWAMLAHYHGQIWNASEFARAFGVADTTVRRHLDQLVGTFALRLLPAWHENIGKRQVKSPRVYIADSGILHALLGLTRRDDVLSHPKVGASWEGFVLEQVVRRLRARPEECFFWRTHTGAELDLLVVRGRQRLGFEIKRTTAPTMTPSMRSALSDLGLASLTVLHAGEHSFPLERRVRAVAFREFLGAQPPPTLVGRSR
jgi:predicted AAA+ superfamily ATPase